MSSGKYTVLRVFSWLSELAFFVASSSLLTASAAANSFSSISAHWKKTFRHFLSAITCTGWAKKK